MVFRFINTSVNPVSLQTTKDTVRLSPGTVSQSLQINNLAMKLIIAFWLLIIPMGNLLSQRFIRVEGLWSRLSDSQIQLMDFDLDNDYDICAWGMYSTPFGSSRELVVYRNNGNGQYDSILIIPDGIYINPEGLLNTADINRDNVPELVSVVAEGSTLKFIQYNGSDFIRLQDGMNVTGVGIPGISLADFDNDGSEEVLKGLSVYDPYKDLYGFLEFNNVYEERTRWIDMNNDGMSDILRIHREQYVSNSTSYIYLNNGSGFDETSFSYDKNRPWDIITGDYNNDGLEDLVIFSFITGSSVSGSFAELYKNNGYGNFVYVRDITTASGGRFTDLDNDGDLDMVFLGHSETWGVYYLQSFLNNGNDDFSLAEIEGISTGETGDLCVGDYDGDGDNDILLSADGSSTGMVLLRNMLVEDDPSKANSAPSAPSNLRSEVNFNRVKLTWDPSADAETPAAALTYNVYINKDNLSLAASPNADTLTGFKYTFRNGNAGAKCFYDIRCLEDGKYYWSVQAVDNSNMTSGFAATGSFEISGTVPEVPAPLLASPVSDTKVELRWQDNSLFEEGFVVEMYYDSIPYFRPAGFYETKRVGADVNSCIIDGLTAETEYVFRVLAYNCSASSPYTPVDTVKTYPPPFTKKMILDYYRGHQAEWADFDRDGDLDVLMVYERDSSNYDIRYTRILVNETDTLTELKIPLPVIYTGYLNFGSANWFDYDSDGLQDIFLVKVDQLKPKIWVYKNNGDSTFRDIKCDSLLTIDPFRRAPSFADYDNDGDTDILMTGKNQTTSAIEAIILENADSGKFNPILIENMTGIIKSRMPWGDFNNDGYLDIMANEPKADNTAYLSIYKNNGDKTFTKIPYENLAGLNRYDGHNGDMRWGDCNSDGFADIIISGGDSGSSGTGITRVYINNGDETFTDIGSAGIWSLLGNVCIEWGDFNNDGMLDVLHAGANNVNGEADKTRVFYNSGGTFVKGEYNSFLPIDQVSMSTAADYDNDGDLDILVQGQNPMSHPQIALYLNFQPVSNTRPEAPAGLRVEHAGNEVILWWDSAADPETPSAGLSYNVYLKGALDTVISPASLESGKRTVVGIGNAGYNHFIKVKNLPEGSYTWSVQSIDNCYEGSLFATEQSFEHVDTGIAEDEINGGPGLLMYPNPVSERMTLKIGNSDYGYCEIIISDMNGRQLKRMKAITLPYDINTDFLKPGVYLITVIQSDATHESRFVKN